MSDAWRTAVSSGSRVRFSGKSAFRTELVRVLVDFFFWTPAFVELRDGLSGAGILVGLAGFLLAEVDPGISVFFDVLSVGGGVCSLDPLPESFGAMVIIDFGKQKKANLPYVKQFRGIDQVSVVEQLPR